MLFRASENGSSEDGLDHQYYQNEIHVCSRARVRPYAVGTELVVENYIIQTAEVSSKKDADKALQFLC